MSLMLNVLLILGLFLQSPHQHHHQSGQAPADGRFNPNVIADSKGRFYLAYVERKAGRSNLFVRSSAEGQDWSEPVRVNNIDGDAAVRSENPPKLAVAPGGDLYLCWANERERWKGDIRFSRSTDAGRSFSPAITINSDASAPPAGHAFQSIAVDSKGIIHIAWIDERNKKPADRGAEIWTSRSSDGGLTFSRDRKILSDVCECCRTALAVDSAGRVFLSYRTVPRKGAMYRDIVVAISRDSGITFKPRIVSQDNWEINACPIAGPSLSIDRSGAVSIVWFTGGGEHPGLYYATFGKDSFSPRKRVDPNRRPGKHAHMTALQDGRLAIAWEGVEDGPVVRWGLLGSEETDKTGVETGGSFPIIAITNKSAVVVGALMGKSDVFVRKVNIH